MNECIHETHTDTLRLGFIFWLQSFFVLISVFSHFFFSSFRWLFKTIDFSSNFVLCHFCTRHTVFFPSSNCFLMRKPLNGLRDSCHWSISKKHKCTHLKVPINYSLECFVFSLLNHFWWYFHNGIFFRFLLSMHRILLITSFYGNCYSMHQK